MNESIKLFLDKESIIVCDTNVYLNLYEYSPEAADFFVTLLESSKDRIILPNTVHREFKKNQKKSHGRQKKKFEIAFKNFKDLVNSFSDKSVKQFEILASFLFPDVQKLKETFQEKVDEVHTAIQTYEEEHDIITYINNEFLTKDKPSLFIEELIKNRKLLESYTVDELYTICEDGEIRYKKMLPPGFEDGKGKTGIQMFNDLIIWKEIMRYSSRTKQNILFVTDDIKKDWWSIQGVHRIGLHPFLIEEFEVSTKCEVLGVTSIELFSYLAWEKQLEIPAAIEWVLHNSFDSYISGIINAGLAYDIIGEFPKVFTYEESGYDGSELDFDEDYDHIELISGEFEGYNDELAYYKLRFSFSIKAYSQEYVGRDEDTKEVILSPLITHVFKGVVEVIVTKEIDNYIDKLIHDYSYSKVEITDLEIVEDESYTHNELCDECGHNLGQYPSRNGGYVCEKCATTNKDGEICPYCGEKVPFELMAGNGFCMQCTIKHGL
ncbi:PIN-like domain-containing protein [Paenibacillus marinisediminis]